MRAGTLRHLLAIEAPAEAQNAFGEPVETWASFATVWASREDLTGREAFLAQQTKAEVTTSFRLRYLPGVTAKMRILSDSILYQIESIQDPDGRGRELVIMARRDI